MPTPEAPAGGGRLEPLESVRFELRPSRLWGRAPELIADLTHQGARPVGLAEVLDGADRRARPLTSDEPALRALDLPVEAGFAWDTADAADPRWYPQGISSSHDAAPAAGTWEGREALVVSWALDGHAGVRVSFAELEDGVVRGYRHVSLGEPVRAPWERRVALRPVRIHAGGIAWVGPHLWVADTLRGLRAFAVDEIVELPSGELVMPQVGAHRLAWPAVLRGPRFSYISLQWPAGGETPALLSGEYRDRRPGARIVRWLLPSSPQASPIAADRAFASPATNMQGVLGVEGHLLLASSAGRRAGRLAAHSEDTPEQARLHPWATGPEDLTHLSGRGLVMSLTERPYDPVDCASCGRVVFGVAAAELIPAA